MKQPFRPRDPRKPLYVVPLSFHVTIEQKDLIKETAWKSDLTISQLVRRALLKDMPELNGHLLKDGKDAVK